MAEDMRTDMVRARRTAIGCLWLFLAIPGAVGIFGLITSGFTSLFAWTISSIFVGATLWLLWLFVRARTLKVAQPGSGRGGRFRDLNY